MTGLIVFWCVFGGFIGILIIYAITQSIIDHFKIKKNEESFKYDSETRIIKRNSGYGDYYYPQFYFNGDWIDFLDDNCSVRRGDISRCETFIINKRASKKPNIEVVKTNEDMEKLYSMEDYEK